MSRTGKRLIALFAASSLWSVGLAFAQLSESSEASFAEDDNTVVLQLSRELPRIQNADPTPFLRVYGSGRVLIHYPVYMKRAGDYTLQLTPAELDSLLSSLTERGVVDFDQALVKQQTKLTERQQGLAAMQSGSLPTMIERSDEVTTVIDVHMESYQPAGVSAPAQLNVHKQIRWSALEWDARQFPGISALQELHATCADLMSLTERPDLQKLPN